MANIVPAYVQVHPSYTAPEIIVQQNQASGAFDTLADGDISVRLGDGDQYAYIRTMQVRTRIAGGQQAYNELPSCTPVMAQISTPSYLFRVRAEYDHHDTAAGSRWGVSIPQVQSYGMRQAHFQNARTGLLYGFNPQNGEGLLNAAGATAVNLPPDSNNNDTISTYDNGQMAFYLLSLVTALKTRMYQLGMPARVEILGPQRALGAFEYQGIVQLTQFQRVGAGSLSVRGTIEAQLKENGDSLGWSYDDTLIGKGANGNDAILIVIPEIEKPTMPGVNTNVFADAVPSLDACTWQLADMAAPREIPTPLPGGAIDVLSEWRITSGWAVRPEGVTILSAQYS